nr:hypothetical protein [Tanacetum cinerariifolium]
MSREELYFSNISKTANVSKSISIPNEDLSDDTTPSVARKFLNEASSAHQEFHKIIREEILPIINQVDARVQNFEIQFLKEAAKFVGDFKSLAKEADSSLAKHKILELDIERLLKAVVSQDIISVVQNVSVVDKSDLQTELECMKERFENCIIKKETEYAKIIGIKSDSRKNTKFAKKSIAEILSKIGETKALSKPVTSSSVSKPQEPKGMNNDKVISPGMFRISPDKVSREAKKVPNTVSASSRTKPITVSQPSVITKKGMNSNSNGFSSTGLDNTKTRKPQPRSNTKNDRVPSASKSSRSRNKEVKKMMENASG